MNEPKSTRQLFWASWYQPEDDYRPLTFPPNEAVLGWWVTGVNESGEAFICAAVIGEGVTFDDQVVSAGQAISKDWPELIIKGWRFCIEVDPDFRPSDRFPLSDWMVERFDRFAQTGPPLGEGQAVLNSDRAHPQKGKDSVS